MADRLIALYYFHGVFVYGVVKLSFTNKFFSSLNDCVVTKQTFWIVLLRLFSFKFRRFLSTVGFSNEDNCCLLQGIGKLIKENLSKGIFKVD